MSASRGLRARLMVGLAATLGMAVATATGYTVWKASVLVRDAEDALRRRSLAQARTVLDLETFAIAVGGETARDRLVADSPSAAAEVALGSGLDVLEGFEADGTTIASAAWPESRDTRRVPPVIGSPRTGAVWSAPTASGPRPAWVVRLALRPDDPPGRTWVAGRWVDQGPNRSELLGGLGARLEPGMTTAGSDTLAVAVASGEPRAWRIGIDDPIAGTAAGRLALPAGIAALVCAVMAAAAGWWIVRTATRPLDAVAEAFEAVADGRADYDFPLPGDAVFGGVVGSYSRMRRALDAERARVRASERVAAWTETARRVAHEVKNPLAPIRLTVENLVKARERAPDRFDRMFTDGTRAILEEVERLRRVVSEFSEYARLPEPVPRPEDLDTIVDSVLALHGSDDRLAIRRERAVSVPAIAVDRDLVALAIRNLVDNAIREGVAHGGEVVVRTGIAGNVAFVEIRDHGAGLDDEALARALEPDFSSREGGSGLGLAIAQRIAVEHGGMVSIANAADGRGGAVATLRLPLERGNRG